MSTTATSKCPGCGLEMPIGSAPPYDGYYRTSTECWSVYTEVLGAEFSNAILFGRVHQLTVDTYAVQHAGGPHPDKSVAVHLTGLWFAIEAGVRSPDIAPRLERLASLKPAWPHFELPERRSKLTVGNVALVASITEHIECVDAWAHDVWDHWAHVHEEIADFVGQHLPEFS